MMSNNKALSTYFIYLAIGFIFFLTFHINEFPTKYTFTDWLINYEGGFVRRGLLGQIIFELSKFLNFQIKFVMLFFQITIYSIYFLIFYLLLSKRKANFFWLLIIFSPISFLYPMAELEALGRKDIFVITFFLIFSIINYKSLNILLFSFISLFSLSCLIHEITIFYIFHYLFVFYIKNKFFINQQVNKKHYLIFFLSLVVLLYLNLYLHNFVVIEDIVNSYNYENLTTASGSFSHISPSIDSVFLKTFNNISLTSVARYGFLVLINSIPFIYFIKIKKEYEDKYFNSQNIFFAVILLSIPLYLLIFDWGRVIYINHNFFIIIVILIFNLDLINESYLQKKLENLSKGIKIFSFIIICLSFSPKLLVTDDLGSKPLYKSVTKIFKIINNLQK
tara:strand:- start:438 stop:1613 length:1176 start_codon:yes stop_codon:yes gene_type:complete